MWYQWSCCDLWPIFKTLSVSLGTKVQIVITVVRTNNVLAQRVLQKHHNNNNTNNINKEPSLLNIIVFTSYFKEDFSKVRVMSYINSDVFLVCFSIDDVKSLVHVQESWVPELRQHVPNTPFILVGTKLDVRFQQPDIQVGNRK